jgi:hypothetical protein
MNAHAFVAGAVASHVNLRRNAWHREVRLADCATRWPWMIGTDRDILHLHLVAFPGMMPCSGA